MQNVFFLLFDDFETLDLFGPAEILGKVEDYKLRYCSLKSGLIKSRQGARILTEPMAGNLFDNSILLIPGGLGTRRLVNDNDFLQALRDGALASKFCLTVCTGAALLAKTGLIDGLCATSNKKALDWVRSQRPQVNWISKARYVVDAKFYTSSGVSAGLDMALGFVQAQFGRQKALQIAGHIEYLWRDDATYDPFGV